VSADEVAREWRLDARLVSLATCHSALGLDSASEGLLGLQYAFLAAGARSVLVSRWQVEDAATARLMQEFHAALLAAGPGEDAATALQQAQQRVRAWRDPTGATPYAHPAYWAGFVLVGSGE
jgi:CHAT domain-containing protein